MNNHVLSISNIIRYTCIYVISVLSQYYHMWSIQFVRLYYNGLTCIVRYDCTTWTCQWTYDHDNDCQRSIYIYSAYTVTYIQLYASAYIHIFVLSEHTTVQCMNNCHPSCYSRLWLLPCPCPVRDRSAQPWIRNMTSASTDSPELQQASTWVK